MRLGRPSVWLPDNRHENAERAAFAHSPFVFLVSPSAQGLHIIKRGGWMNCNEFYMLFPVTDAQENPYAPGITRYGCLPTLADLGVLCVLPPPLPPRSPILPLGPYGAHTHFQRPRCTCPESHSDPPSNGVKSPDNTGVLACAAFGDLRKREYADSPAQNHAVVGTTSFVSPLSSLSSESSSLGGRESWSVLRLLVICAPRQH